MVKICKKGFTLIEVLITIIVMSIALMSISVMILQTSSSNEIPFFQESIYQARAKLELVSTASWDENSYDENSNMGKIIKTQNSNADLDARKGLLPLEGRRQVMDKNASDLLSPATNLEKDVSDFIGTSTSLAVESGETSIEGKYEYKKNVLNSTIAVSYVGDSTDSGSYASDSNITKNLSFPSSQVTSSGGSTNIKGIKSTIQTQELNISLNSFVSNIGTSQVKQRILE